MRCVECGLGEEPVECPRWDCDLTAIRLGWLEGRCGNCGHVLDISSELDEGVHQKQENSPRSRAMTDRTIHRPYA